MPIVLVVLRIALTVIWGHAIRVPGIAEGVR